MANKKVGLIIIDGLGLSDNNHGNAWKLAKTPTLNWLLRTFPHCTLQASGPAVGLPEGQPGNSEIGHLNIGAGRTILSELVRINKDIDSSNFVNNPNLLSIIKQAKQKHSKIHVIGLTSNSGVHSQLTHILKSLEVFGKSGVKTVLHCISDGRDAPVMEFTKVLPKILLAIDKYPNLELGSIGGRYYGMDRNQNWDRIDKAIDTLLHNGPSFKDASSYVMSNYKNKATDEFIVPAYKDTSSKLEANDIVFFANFRPDRARQLSHCIKKSKLYKHESKLWPLHLTLATMVKYDGIDSDIILYPPQEYPNTLGKVLADAGLKQLRIAETEKYAHVTFFLDGGKELDYKNEEKILIPSAKVKTYDLLPKMSALDITAELLNQMNKYDVFICNFANCDMVGHTGNLQATIKAIETIDVCLEDILVKAKALGITLFITADHGNCDQMLDNNDQPVTSHTTAPVFFISTDKSLILKDGCLANIAPTILKYLDIKLPKEMNKKSLY